MSRITDLDCRDRPREKLIREGASALSDKELMAIFLRVGTTGASAIELAQVMLDHFGSLANIFRAAPETLYKIKGVGEAKYVQLQAVLEMARRVLQSACYQTSVMDSREVVYDYVRLNMAGETREIFQVLWLDGACRLIASEVLSEGTSVVVEIFPRKIIERALFHKASGLIVVHNHPSECEVASHDDIILTKALRSALAWIDVQLHDHWIVTQRGVFPIDECSEAGYKVA